MATLGDLGLSEYEERVYRALLRSGPTTAKELSRASDVPMGRIYDVLNTLEGSSLVRSQNASRPKKYAAVEPETALDRLLVDKRRELEAEIRQYEEIVDELSGQLEAAEPADEQFWTVAVGAEDTLDLFVERLAAATGDITMVASTPSPQFDVGDLGALVADELRSALERGVDVSVLVSPDLLEAIPDDVRARYDRVVADHAAFTVRIAETVGNSFTLIDRTEVCIEVPNPLAPDEAFALIAVRDPTFAANVYDEFEPRWERADPLPASPG